jgi:hypothetical protein
VIFIEKLLTPILSSIVLAIFLASDSGYFPAVVWVSLPVFFLGGTLISVSVDYFLDRKKLKNQFYKYCISFFLFGLVGVLIITIFSLFQGSITELTLTPLIMLGFLPALIYFHLSLIVTILFTRFANM